jgi:hypothetical protein
MFVDAGLSQFRSEPREYRIKELLALAKPGFVVYPRCGLQGVARTLVL